MTRKAITVSVLTGLGLVSAPGTPVAAQTRVVVPIVIAAPRAAAPRASMPPVVVTAPPASAQPGVTTTRITVRDTSSAGRSLNAAPTGSTLRTAPAGTSSILVTTRTASPQPGVTTTGVTVRDVSGAGRSLSGRPPTRTLATGPVGTPSVLVTVERPAGRDGSLAPGVTRVTVEDSSSAGRIVGSPGPVTSQRAAAVGQRTWTITSDAPIDTPIVILGH